MTVKCHYCGITEEKRGAIEALEFLCAHNHHTTYVKGELAESETP